MGSRAAFEINGDFCRNSQSFSYTPRAFNARWWVLLEFCKDVVRFKNCHICQKDVIQYHNVTDRQTDRQTEMVKQYRALCASACWHVTTRRLITAGEQVARWCVWSGPPGIDCRHVSVSRACPTTCIMHHAGEDYRILKFGRRHPQF